MIFHPLLTDRGWDIMGERVCLFLLVLLGHSLLTDKGYFKGIGNKYEGTRHWVSQTTV